MTSSQPAATQSAGLSNMLSPAGSSQYAAPGEPLIGATGKSFVQQLLANSKPAEALRDIQQRGGMANPRCKPLLGMLDYLHVSRLDAHKHVLESATAVLLKRIQSMQTEGLLKLLADTFIYVSLPMLLGLSELRGIPMAVLDRLEKVPAEYLTTLAESKDLFDELSPKVQRQVHEQDKRVLQSHSAPLMVNYIYKSTVVQGSLNMDEFCEPIKGVTAFGRAGPGRAQLRNTNDSLQRLWTLMAGSPKIYRGIIDLTVTKFRDSDSLYIGIKETGYCILRSQLLMACHDKPQFRHLAMQDPCHQLAWTLDSAIMQSHTALDAAVKQAGPAEKVDLTMWPEYADPLGVKPQHLQKLSKFFKDAEEATFVEMQRRSRGGLKRKAPPATASPERPAGSREDQQQEPGRVLGEAGMIVRDPSALHLLVFQVLRRLKHASEAGKLPCDDADLTFIVRMLQLSAECRQMLRGHSFSFPEAPDGVMHDLFPQLMILMLEEDDSGPSCPVDDDEDGDPDLRIVSFLKREEVARRVVQAYTLQRVQRRDWPTVLKLLACIGQVFDSKDSRPLAEWAAFASTLARHAAQLLTARKMQLDDPIWKATIDRVLLRAVDIDSQVHEDVVRILIAGAEMHVKTQAAAHVAAAAGRAPPSGHFPLDRLIDYLQACIRNSKHSRKRHAKRLREEAAFIEDDAEGAGYDAAEAYSSRRVADDADGGGPSSQWDNLDGVKGIYSRFLPDIREVNAMFERRGSERIVRPSPPSLGMQLGITPHNAPELIAYMTGGDATVWEEMTGLDQHGQKLKRQAEREQEHARKLAQQELLNGEGSRRESTDLASDEPSPGVAQEISEAVSMETG
eukprot:jgi/Astpho2/9209/Aster-07167